jgi:hypothetical protein
MEVPDSNVACADIPQVLVTRLVRPVRIAMQLIIAEYLYLLLILRLVAFLNALRGLHGESQGRTAEAEDRVLGGRSLVGSFEEWGLQNVARVPSFLRRDLEHVLNGQQGLIADAWQVLL